MAIHGADGAGRAHPRIELKYNPHEGVEEPYLVLADGENGVAAAKDLATYISRAKSVDKGAAIRLIARGTVLGVFACSRDPAGCDPHYSWYARPDPGGSFTVGYCG